MDFKIWGIVNAGLGTYKEVSDNWTLKDVFNALEFLEIKSEIENTLLEESKENNQKYMRKR